MYSILTKLDRIEAKLASSPSYRGLINLSEKTPQTPSVFGFDSVVYLVFVANNDASGWFSAHLDQELAVLELLNQNLNAHNEFRDGFRACRIHSYTFEKEGDVFFMKSDMEGSEWRQVKWIRVMVDKELGRPQRH